MMMMTADLFSNKTKINDATLSFALNWKKMRLDNGNGNDIGNLGFHTTLITITRHPNANTEKIPEKWHTFCVMQITNHHRYVFHSNNNDNDNNNLVFMAQWLNWYRWVIFHIWWDPIQSPVFLSTFRHPSLLNGKLEYINTSLRNACVCQLNHFGRLAGRTYLCINEC